MGTPGFYLVMSNIGFPHMIENEDLIRMLIDERNYIRQVAMEYQDVVRHSILFKDRNSFVEITSKDERVVGFILNHVPDSLESWMGRKGIKNGAELVRG